VKEIIAWFAVRARAKGLQLNSALPPGIPPEIRGDPVRLRQILTNLIGNAIKFTETGSVTVQMEILESAIESLTVKFQVLDTGIGLERASAAACSKASRKPTAPPLESTEALALGSRSRNKLVELLGGEIGVESERAQGSQFWFTVKFESRSPPEEPRAGRSRAATGYRFEGMRVLVRAAAGSGTLLESLQALHCMTGAISSVGAIIPELRQAAQDGSPYHAALLDIDVPGLDISIGFDVGKDPLVFNTPLIAIEFKSAVGS
jgi:hypothetical protein